VSLPGAHPLVEPVVGGFAINLAPAMRAELQTPVQVLPLRPDFGHAEAPLALPADARVRVTCGEVAFDVYAAEAAAAVPRPRFGADLREGGWYTLGVALAFLALVLIVRAIPEDPLALAGDDIGRLRRLSPMVTIPLDINSPEVASKIADTVPGGGGSAAARGPQGQAGHEHAPKVPAHRAVAGRVAPKDAQEAAGDVRKNTLLAVLDGPISGSAAEVFEHRAALGPDKETIMGNLLGTTTASAYGVGGLSAIGSGAGGGGTGDHTIGLGVFNTLGKFGPGQGPGNGPGRGYGTGVGILAKRAPKTPDVLPGLLTTQGTLDKEIIRRIVRRHLNEVKYCYDQALVRQPKLDGRIVVKFTIAGTGQVLASFVQSTTLGSPAVEMCVANAVKRWDFPAPRQGGLAIVSYPFTFSPAGN
jgi:TonB family protein